MALKNCPNCNLVLFDTDTHCIYCGWNEEEAEKNTIETTEKNEVKPEEIEQTKDVSKEIDVSETKIEPKREETKSAIKEKLEKIIETTEIKPEEEKKEPEKPTVRKIKANNKIPASDYAKGVRRINGITFNVYDMIDKYSLDSPILIIKEIRAVTHVDLSTAKAIFDGSAENYIRTHQQKSTPVPKPVPRQQEHNNIARNRVQEAKNNAYSSAAYELIKKHGPNRKIQIINELMRTVHIDLPSAMDITERAIERYIANGNR